MMKDRPRKILTVILSVVIYFFAVFCSAYGALIDRVGLTDFYRGFCQMIATPYLCMLVGVPYFAIGQYFAKHTDAVRHKGFRIALLPCLLLLLAEILLTRHYDLHKSTDCFVMLAPTAVCIFAIAASFDGTIKMQSRCERLLQWFPSPISFGRF